jgi:tetratricopeptide (TPR) repeat protein
LEYVNKALQLDNNYAIAYFIKIRILIALNKHKEAEICFMHISKSPTENTFEWYFHKGNALNDIGKKNEAIEAYDRAISLKPDYADAYLNKGRTLSDIGKKNETIEAYDRAISLKPDYADAYLNKGNVLRSIGKINEAIEAYDRAISLKPDYADAYLNKGRTLRVIGKNMRQ